MKGLWLALTFAGALAGCSGGGGGGTSGVGASTPSGTGSISGTISIEGDGVPTGAAETGQAKETDTSSASPPAPDFVPGKLLVQFKPGINDKDALNDLLARYQDVKLSVVGQLYPEGPYLFHTEAYQNDQLPVSEAKTRTMQVLERFQKEPSVSIASLSYLLQAQRVPNDTGYYSTFQWNMRQIDLPTAWEITTGRPDIVVAVLDGGIRADHPELAPLLGPGFDFVSDAILSGDGNGWDLDPTDPGPMVATSFHGTHVAGTIAALSNNNKGIVGTAWDVRVMPVRVLGLGGGSTSDIIAGMRWAAGLPGTLPGTPPPPLVPAKIINMSLGRVGSCDPFMQRAIDDVVNAGVTVVVSAGNDGQKGNPPSFPASCANVIAVGAVRADFGIAPYSTKQSYVFISAPGGDFTGTSLRGVVSTNRVSQAGQPLYAFLEGTSMAAPHVSGVVALMQSAAADAGTTLSPSQVMDLLRTTATDLGIPGRDPSFGHGLVRAGAAVAAAKGVSKPIVGVPYPQPNLFIGYTGTPFAPFSQQFAIWNTGTGSGVFCPPTTNQPWLQATISGSGILASYDGRPLPNGVNQGRIKVTVATDGPACSTSPGESFEIPFILLVGTQPLSSRQSSIRVRLLRFDESTLRLVKQATTSLNGFGYRFDGLAPGTYLVEAGIDDDGSDEFGDFFTEGAGVYPSREKPQGIVLEAGQIQAGIDFTVVPGQVVAPLD